MLFENRDDWWFFSVSLLVLALMPIIGGISYLRSGRVERRRYRIYLATLTPDELSSARTRAGRKAAEAGVAKAWNALRLAASTRGPLPISFGTELPARRKRRLPMRCSRERSSFAIGGN